MSIIRKRVKEPEKIITGRKFRSIINEELKNKLHPNFRMYIGDSYYQCMSPAMVESATKKGRTKKLKRGNSTADCDNFAAHCHSDILFYANKKKMSIEYAEGIVWRYKPSVHALNFFIGYDLKFYFLEMFTVSGKPSIYLPRKQDNEIYLIYK
jgi:hypothetical protein